MNGRKQFQQTAWLSVLSAVTITLSAQQPMFAPEGRVNLLSADLAALESQERRRDFPCEVKPLKAELGYDMVMHAGYTVPAETRMVVITRVRSVDRPDEDSFHFLQHIRTPSTLSEGIGQFEGRLDAGEGNYHVEWLMRDPGGRICSDFWNFRVEAPVKGFRNQSAVAPGVVQSSRTDPYATIEARSQPARSDTLPSVAVYLSLTPMRQGAALLDAGEEEALASMLRSIVREPNIGKVALVAFNLEQRQVLCRQTEQIDLPAIKAALAQAKMGTVGVNLLAEKKGEDAKFLAFLLGEQQQSPSAVIFLAPRAAISEGIPSFIKSALPLEGVPVFHFSYAPDPKQEPLGDSISKFVQLFQGRTYEIRRPRDFYQAWIDLVGRIRVLSPTRNSARVARASH